MFFIATDFPTLSVTNVVSCQALYIIYLDWTRNDNSPMLCLDFKNHRFLRRKDSEGNEESKKPRITSNL
jgi:hypothetical protein